MKRAPSDIAAEMAALLNAGVTTDEQRQHYRDLGFLLVQTPGETALDALAFTTMTAVLVCNLADKMPDLEMSDGTNLHQTATWASSFIVGAMRTLETLSGTAFEGVVGQQATTH